MLPCVQIFASIVMSCNNSVSSPFVFIGNTEAKIIKPKSPFAGGASVSRITPALVIAAGTGPLREPQCRLCLSTSCHHFERQREIFCAMYANMQSLRKRIPQKFSPRTSFEMTTRLINPTTRHTNPTPQTRATRHTNLAAQPPILPQNSI